MATEAPAVSSANFEGALRADMHSVMSEPASPTPAESTSEGTTETQAAPADDSTSASPDGQAPTGSTPEQPTPPASDGQSDYDRWLARYGDPERAAKEAFATEQRAVAMAKELKEIKARAGTPQTPTEAVRPETPPETAYAAPVAEVESPDIGLDSPEVVNVVLGEQARDAWSAGVLNEYQANTDRGQMLAAELDKIAGSIRAAEEYLAQPERAQALGFESPLDEFQIQEVQGKLQQFQWQQIRVEREAMQLSARNNSLRTAYQQRHEQIKQVVLAPVFEHRREAEHQAVIETRATDFLHNEWKPTVEQAFRALNVPEKFWERLDANARKAALVRPGPLQKGEMYQFVVASIKSDLAFGDEFYRDRQGQYGRQKAADGAQAAPRGSAAIAATPATESVDWEKALKAGMRASRKSA
jgi:hypothetical protein